MTPTAQYTRVGESSSKPFSPLAGTGPPQPTPRPPRFCDVCLAVHACLYCAADDAYLCTSCDVEVHNANSLAQRHERVRLGPNGAPMKIERKGGGGDGQRVKKEESTVVSVVSANSGSSGAVIRKRTKLSRGQQSAVSSAITSDVGVNGSCDGSAVPGRSPGNGAAVVPVMTPEQMFQAEHGDCGTLHSFGGVKDEVGEDGTPASHTLDNACRSFGTDSFMWNPSEMDGEICGMINNVQGYGGYPSGYVDCEGMEDDDFGMELGGSGQNVLNYSTSKAEGEADPDTSTAFQHSSVTSEPSSDEARGMGVEETVVMDQHLVKEEVQADLEGAASHLNLFGSLDGFSDRMLSSCPSLRLNYEDVMSAWSDRGGSPWLEEDACVQADHEDSDFYDPTGCMENGVVPVLYPRSSREGGEDVMVTVGDDGLVAENREARVLRYREKRRNRLFSKKVRYEVRKLNAERRPRIKGRFVKRTV